MIWGGIGSQHIERVDLGVCRGYWFAGDPDRVAVTLPGAFYLPAAPLLWYTRETLQARGWSVLDVWDEWDRSVEAHQWVAERFGAALQHVGLASTRLVVAKSLSTLALPTAVDEGLPGVWLTPLLDEESLRAALVNSTAPTLLVGGTADSTWDSQFASGLLDVDVFEVEGVDHLLQHPGNPVESIHVLQTVTDQIGRFVAQLE